MSTRELGNTFLHIGAGGGLAALVCWNLWFMVLATFVYAFLREQAQHRYIIKPSGAVNNGRLNWVDKRTFFDFSWLGWWQAFEIGCWVVGAAVACLLWQLFA